MLRKEGWKESSSEVEHQRPRFTGKMHRMPAIFSLRATPSQTHLTTLHSCHPQPPATGTSTPTIASPPETKHSQCPSPGRPQ